MIRVSDIVKILEQIPIWQTVVALPKRVAELEARVEALEQQPTKQAADCPLCRAPMRVTRVESDPQFGDRGVQEHTLLCSVCGHSETRQVDPSR